MRKLIFLGFAIFIAGAATAFASVYFSDVDSNSWFVESLNNVSDKGIIEGYPDGTFKPANGVNRAEMAVIVDRTLRYEHARELAFAFVDWSYEQVNPGTYAAIYKEISLDGHQIVQSGPNAGGNSYPELTDTAIDALAEIVDAQDERSFYDCLHALKQPDLFPSRCEVYGDIEMEDTVFGTE